MSKKRAFANQEKEFQARRLGKLGRALTISLATLLSFAAIVLLAADQLYRPDTFVIAELKIKGKFKYLHASDIEAVVREQNLGNFFSVELDEIKAQVENLAWVKSADVRREWPNALSISIDEHRPAMRWGEKKWVSTSGVVVELPNDLDAPNVIVLHGSEVHSKRLLLQAASWKKDLSNYGLSLKDVRLSGSDAWTLGLRADVLDSDFKLLLGHENVDQRLARFKTLFSTQLQFSEYPLERVDARYPDGLAVKHGATKINNDETAAVGVDAVLVARTSIVTTTPYK